MTDKYLRIPRERLLTPAAAALGDVAPEHITLLGFTLGLVGVGFIAAGMYSWGLVFWLLNRTLDGLDGVVARLREHQSDWGGYLDIVLDFVIYALVPSAMVVADPSVSAGLALALLLSSFYLNSASWMYLSALLEKRRHTQDQRFTSISMPAGLVEGAETVAFYTLFLLFPNLKVTLFSLMAVMVLLTAGQRLWWAGRTLREKQ